MRTPGSLLVAALFLAACSSAPTPAPVATAQTTPAAAPTAQETAADGADCTPVGPLDDEALVRTA